MALSVLGSIDDSPFPFQITHPLLRERRPDDVTRQILHRRVIFRRYPVAAEDVESGMFPCAEHPDYFFRDLSLFQKHLEHFVAEDGLQLLQFQRRRDADALKGTRHASAAIETSVRHEDVAVRIESEKVAKSLHGNHLQPGGLYR